MGMISSVLTALFMLITLTVLVECIGIISDFWKPVVAAVIGSVFSYKNFVIDISELYNL